MRLNINNIRKFHPVTLYGLALLLFCIMAFLNANLGYTLGAAFGGLSVAIFLTVFVLFDISKIAMVFSGIKLFRISFNSLILLMLVAFSMGATMIYTTKVLNASAAHYIAGSEWYKGIKSELAELRRTLDTKYADPATAANHQAEIKKLGEKITQLESSAPTVSGAALRYTDPTCSIVKRNSSGAPYFTKKRQVCSGLESKIAAHRAKIASVQGEIARNQQWIDQHNAYLGQVARIEELEKKQLSSTGATAAAGGAGYDGFNEFAALIAPFVGWAVTMTGKNAAIGFSLVVTLLLELLAQSLVSIAQAAGSGSKRHENDLIDRFLAVFSRDNHGEYETKAEQEAFEQGALFYAMGKRASLINAEFATTKTRNAAKAGFDAARKYGEFGYLQAELDAKMQPDPVMAVQETDPALPAPELPTYSSNSRIEKPGNTHMIIDPVIDRGEWMTLYAQEGVGKSWVASGLARIASDGGEYLGWTSAGGKRVLFIDTEMGAAMVQERFGGSIPRNVEVVCLHEMTPTPSFGEQSGRDQITRLIDRVRPDLIVIDNLQSNCMEAVTSMPKWKEIEGWLVGLRSSGISLIMVAHANDQNKLNGHRAQRTVVNSVLKLSKPDDYEADEGVRILVEFEKTRRYLSDDAKRFEAAYKDGVWTVSKPGGNSVSTRAVSSERHTDTPQKHPQNEVLPTFSATPEHPSASPSTKTVSTPEHRINTGVLHPSSDVSARPEHPNSEHPSTLAVSTHGEHPSATPEHQSSAYYSSNVIPYSRERAGRKIAGSEQRFADLDQAEKIKIAAQCVTEMQADGREISCRGFAKYLLETRNMVVRNNWLIGKTKDAVIEAADKITTKREER